MSLIVGARIKGQQAGERSRVVLFADSHGIDSNDLSIYPRADGKLFSLSPDLSLGISGSYRAKQTIEAFFDMSQDAFPVGWEGSEYRYMISIFVPRLVTIFDMSKVAREDRKFSAIVRVYDELFAVYESLQVQHVSDDFVAIGWGRQGAEHWLAACEEFGVPIDIGNIRLMFSESERRNAGVNRPFYMLDPDEGLDPIEITSHMFKPK